MTETTDRSEVRVSVQDGVLNVVLNRPHRHNALTQSLARELAAAFSSRSVSAGGAVHVAVVRGNGPSFCAGWDLKEANNDTKSLEVIRDEIETMQELTRAMRRAPFPIIAVVHGYALGAGCELALSADLVLAASSSTFGFPETTVGLTVTGGFTHILPRIVGITRAKELILLGRRFDAQRAYNLGLVNIVCTPESVEAETAALIAELQAKPALSLRIAKQQIDFGSQHDLESTMTLEVELGAQAAHNPTALETQQAWRARK